MEEEGRNPWKNKTAWIILLFFGLQTSIFFSLTMWLSSMAIERGMVLITASLVLTTISVVQMVGNIVIPALIGKFPSRVKWLIWLTVLGAMGAVVLFVETDWSI